jgi:hypothetical protein
MLQIGVIHYKNYVVVIVNLLNISILKLLFIA